MVLGVGLALGLTGGVLDIVAYSSSLRTERFSTNAEMDDWASSVQATALAGDVLVGVGAAVAVGGLIWLLLARRNRDTSSAAASRLRFGASPMGDSGLMLQGSASF